MKKDEVRELSLALAPLLIIEKRNDEISKRIIKEAKDYFDEEEISEFEDDYEDDKDELINELYQMKNNFRDFLLKDKSHIKEYRKARKIHGEILDSMMNYFESSKYKENNYMNIIKEQKNEIKQLDIFLIQEHN